MRRQELLSATSLTIFAAHAMSLHAQDWAINTSLDKTYYPCCLSSLPAHLVAMCGVCLSMRRSVLVVFVVVVQLCLLVVNGSVLLSGVPQCYIRSYVQTSSTSGLHVQVDAWGKDSARVRISPTELIDDPQPQALTSTAPHSTDCSQWLSERAPNVHTQRHSPSSSAVHAQYGNLAVDVSSSGAVSVSRVSPPLALLSTTSLSFANYTWTSSYYRPSYSAYYAVNWSYTQPGGSTYALGEHHHSREQLAYSDYSIDFTFSETAPLKGDISIPWTLHSSGFGVLWNQPGFGSYSIANSTAVSWTAAATPQFDVLFTTTPAPPVGPTATPAADVVPPYETVLYNLLVATNSFPRALPHYASGFWQCKLRYRSQAEVLEAAQGYVNRSLPLSVIVIDAGNWAELGDFSFDSKCFPDPSAMVSSLRAMGVELMVSLWPHAGALSGNFAYMKSHDLLTHNSTGQLLNESIPWMPWPAGVPQPEASAVDFIAPAAQKYVGSLLVDNYIKHGVKMFWLDADEPDCGLPGQQWWNGRSDVELVSVYPLGVIQTVRTAFDSMGVTDGMVLSRDTWIGGGPMGAAVWSGDIWSTFAELRRQVLVSQNVALSGIYHWTTDVGGFIGGSLGNATFEELAVRWFQFGAFCPIFRTHGDRWPGLPDNECGSTGGHTEVWYFQHADIIESLLQLRESLRPYVEHHLQLATITGRPLLQPMFYTFPDSECYQAEDQFMFGPEWLVAPVLEEKATQRTVWLPKVTVQAVERLRESNMALGGVAVGDVNSVVWRHYYSKQEYTGGQMVTVQTVVQDFPLFQLISSSSYQRTVHVE